MKHICLAAFAAAAFFCTFCGGKAAGGGGDEPPQNDTSFVDRRDGTTYRKVRIGRQVWMAENLNYDAPDDSSRVCYESSTDSCVKYGRMTDVCYGNSADNCAQYGRLYDWFTAKDACPAGWHLPSLAEWMALTDYVGGDSTAAVKLKSKTGWDYDGAAVENTDDYGFSALPGGDGSDGGASFLDAGERGYWWSSTDCFVDYARYMYIHYHREYVGSDIVRMKASLASVRCVQD